MGHPFRAPKEGHFAWRQSTVNLVPSLSSKIPRRWTLGVVFVFCFFSEVCGGPLPKSSTGGECGRKAGIFGIQVDPEAAKL